MSPQFQDLSTPENDVYAVNGERSVYIFTGLTFAISWAAWLTLYLRGGDPAAGANAAFLLIGASGPALAAGLMHIRNRAKRQLEVPTTKDRLRRRFWLWVPVAALFGVLPPLVAALVGTVFGEGPVTAIATKQISESGGLIPALLVMLIAGPLSEEPGWRGYAYPRLRQNHSRTQIAVVYGLVWAFWHLPLFLIDGTSQHDTGVLSFGFIHFVVTTIPLTYLIGHVYELGGVPAAVLMHFAANASVSLLQIEQPIERTVMFITFASAALFVERNRHALPILFRSRDTASRTGAAE